jgi:glucosamine-phosphate N-acetyltransferase
MELFDKRYISPKVTAALPTGFVVRPLNSSDYEKGFLECLAMLTAVGNMPKKDFLDRFNYLKKHNHEYSTS